MTLIERKYIATLHHPKLSLVKRCELTQVHRSGIYFKPKQENVLNLQLMKVIDHKFIDCPHYGVPRMTTYLRKDLGYRVNKKRVERLYKRMGLQTIFPKKQLSRRDKAHPVYPYLLRDLVIDRPNQVWETDITYIPMFRGFMYMVAFIDVFSRKIMNWSISNSMTAEWCKEVYQEAIRMHGKPEIINTDQGSQFTSPIFTSVSMAQENQIKISMDGKGRALDNIYIERFWRSIKYEHIYLNPANGGIQLYEGVKKYIEFYNHQRRHTSLGNQTPNQVFNNHQNAA